MQEANRSMFSSVDIGRAALRIALTATRQEELKVKEIMGKQGIRTTAVDFGGELRLIPDDICMNP